MNKPIEQHTTRGDMVDQQHRQKMALNGEIDKPPEAPTIHSIESATTTTTADTPVRHKKRTSYSEFCRLGNTFDMTGQLA